MADETAASPVPEAMEGTVFPYRGNEQHGVPMHGTPDLVDAYDMGDPVEPEPEPVEPEPVPVRIVRTGGRELTRFRVSRTYAADDAPQVVGKNETRNVVKVRNLSTTAGDRVWVAEQRHIATPSLGYPLDPGAEFSTTAETEVYAMRDPSSPTNPIPLAVFTEYTVREH